MCQRTNLPRDDAAPRNAFQTCYRCGPIVSSDAGAAARRRDSEPDVRTLEGWRSELVGADLRDLLAGRKAVSVGPGRRLVLGDV